MQKKKKFRDTDNHSETLQKDKATLISVMLIQTIVITSSYTLRETFLKLFNRYLYEPTTIKKTPIIPPSSSQAKQTRHSDNNKKNRMQLTDTKNPNFFSALSSKNIVITRRSSVLYQENPLSLKLPHDAASYQKIPVISRIKRANNISLTDRQLQLTTLPANKLFAFIIKGNLDLAALEEAMRHLIYRHESLRTGVNFNSKIQSIKENSEITWNLEKEERKISEDIFLESIIKEELESSSNTRFNLELPPLLKSKVIQIHHKGSTKYLWSCVVSSLFFDHASISIFLREIMLAYNLYQKGSNFEEVKKWLPILSIQNIDYSYWFEVILKDFRNEQLTYWENNLQNVDLHQLPTNSKTIQTKNDKQSSLTFTIPAITKDGVLFLTKNLQTSLFVVLLSCYQYLIYKYTDNQEVCTSILVSNRDKTKFLFSQLKDVIGSIENEIIVHTQIDPSLTVKEFLSIFASTLALTLEHSYITHSEIRKIPSVSSSYEANNNNLCDNFFMFQERPNRDFVLSNTRTTPIQCNPYSYNLNLVIQENPDSSLNGTISFNAALFDEDFIIRFISNYLTALTGFVDSNKKLNQINTLSSKEQTLQSLFTKPLTYKTDQTTIHQVIDNVAHSYPNNKAVWFDEQVLTYKELNLSANRLAHVLIEKSIPQGSIIAVLLERSFEAVISVIGILKAGCAVLFLETKHTDQPSLYRKINDLKPAAIIFHEKTKGLLNFNSDIVLSSQLLDWAMLKGEMAELKVTGAPDITVKGGDIALVTPTSGTTGEPKAVLTPHRGWVNWIIHFGNQDYVYNFRSASRVFLSGTMTFDPAFWQIILTFGMGSTLYIHKNYQDPSELKKFFCLHEISVATFTPSQLKMMHPQDFPTLKCLFCIGEKLPYGLMKQWTEANTHLRFVNGYGPSEVTAGVTLHICQPDEPVSIGKPISNMFIYILGNNQQPMPIGAYGEIYIGGIGVSKGYLNNPAENTKSFVHLPWISDKLLYRTGDRGRYLSDGTLECTGRIPGNRQVKLHTVRTEPEEIEAFLNSHPNIHHSIVKFYDTEKPFLAAFYIANQEFKPDELKNFLRQKGLSNIQIPSIFTRIERIPLTQHGKLNERGLPEVIHTAKNYPILPQPMTIEEQLCQFWQELFLYKEITFSDTFQYLGGTSAKLLELIVKVNETILEACEEKLLLAELNDDWNFSIQTLTQIIKAKKDNTSSLSLSKSMIEICANYSQMR